MGNNPSAFAKTGPGRDRVTGMDTSRFPVEWVTWNDAVQFCGRLSSAPAEKTAGRVYRLPTEAEWEYACRAGTTTAFCFGNSLTVTQANIEHHVNRTTMVGSYQPNAFGLYDMHGNIFEYCQDWYSKAYYAKSPLVDPKGPTAGSSRVLRGGCWGHGYGVAYCRSAGRFGVDPRYHNVDTGFRVVCVR